MWLILSSAVFILMEVSSCLGERKYNIDLNKVEFDSGAKDFVENCNIQMNAHNESTNVVSGSCDYHELPSTAWVMVTGFEKSREGTGYQSQASMNKSGEVCDYLENNEDIIPEIKRQSEGIPESCPVEGSTLKINDFIVEGDYLPDDIPGATEWKFVCELFEEDSKYSKLLASATLFITFNPKDKDDPANKRGQ